MFDRKQEVDSSAVLEQRGLVESESYMRPGDIFTTAAVANRDAAVNVTIVSPAAAGAGEDCVATAFRGKCQRYRIAVEEWGRTGIRLQPLVWPSEGRAHPDVERGMAYTAAEVARRSGARSTDVLRRRKTDMGVALATRHARMARRCLPVWSARQSFVVHGDGRRCWVVGGPLWAYGRRGR